MYCKAFTFGLALARALHNTHYTLHTCNKQTFFARAAFFPLLSPHTRYSYQSTATHTAPATPTARKGHKVDTMSKRTRNTTTDQPATAVAMPQAAPMTHDAKADKARAAAAAKPVTSKGKGKAATAKAAPAPTVTQPAAPAPCVVAVSTAHVHPRHRAYVMPGTNGRGASAGVLINAALATGATKADLCAILTAAKPQNYAHNVKSCQGKVDQHLAWLRKQGATFTMQDGGILVSTDAQMVQAAYYNAKA